MTNDRTVTIRLPAELMGALEEQAFVDGRTVSDMVRRCVVLGLSRSMSLAKVRKHPLRLTGTPPGGAGRGTPPSKGRPAR